MFVFASYEPPRQPCACGHAGISWSQSCVLTTVAYCAARNPVNQLAPPLKLLCVAGFTLLQYHSGESANVGPNIQHCTPRSRQVRVKFGRVLLYFFFLPPPNDGLVIWANGVCQMLPNFVLQCSLPWQLPQPAHSCEQQQRQHRSAPGR